VTPSVLSPLAVLAPLGISPFLALGLLGLAASTTGLVLPPAFAIVEFAPVWIGLLVLAALLKLGRSFKLTKPVAETFGTSESLLALLALAAMFVVPAAAVAQPAPALTLIGLDAGAVASAGLLGKTLLIVAAMSGLITIIAVRMGFDLLTWLSPIPLIDALLQFVKLVVTVAFVAVAVFTPRLAIALNIAVLVGAVIAARWLVRIAGLAGHVLWDGFAGRMWPTDVPREEDNRYGPLRAFVLGGHGLPWLGRVDVWWTDGDWLAARSYDNPKSWKMLAESERCRLQKGLLGTTLSTPGGRFFLTPRYHAALHALAGATGTRLSSRAWADSPTLALRTIPPR
jgi:hypothetical protein